MLPMFYRKILVYFCFHEVAIMSNIQLFFITFTDRILAVYRERS